MTLPKFAASFLAASLIASAASVAQVPTSTQDIVPSSSRPPRSDVEQSDATFRDLVACVVRNQPSRTRNVLDTIPGSYEEADILRTLWPRMETCFDAYRVGGRALRLDYVLLRGVIAETYLTSEFPEGIAAAAAPEEAVARWSRPRAEDGRATQTEMLHAMARCVTARRPAEVGAMLRTAPLSPEERSAIRVLQADLAACLDSGVAFAASRQSLRGLLAEAALHYGEAGRDGFARVGRTEAAAAD